MGQSCSGGSSPLTPLPFDPMDDPVEVPAILELPSLDNPFKIGESPSASCLVVKLTSAMPPTWRGPNPDPAVRAIQKAMKAGKALSTDKAKKAMTTTGKNKQTEAKGIEKGKYFWPSNLFPQISVSQPHRLEYEFPSAVSSCPSRTPHAFLTDTADDEAFAEAGLILRAVLFDLRLIILDLTTGVLELEPLLHSSPQVYTTKQWHRGFKIGIALETPQHVLAWLSFDNLWNLRWHSLEEYNAVQQGRVPDPILDTVNWWSFTAKWLSVERSRRNLNTTTLYAFFTNNQNTPLNGAGSYSLDEVFHLAGLPPNVPARSVFASPGMFSCLVEAFFEFARERWFKTSEDLKHGRARNGTGEFALSASVKEQLKYPLKTLRVHGKAQATVSKRLATGIRTYNTRCRQSHEEAGKPFFNQDPKLMTDADYPFDLAGLRSSVLLYGHLGSLIVGSAWEDLLEQSRESTLHDPAIMNQARELPSTLTDIQRLSLTPVTQLTPAEGASLEAAFGTNPVAAYFAKTYRFKNTPKSRINQAQLSLIPDPRPDNYCRTRVYEVPQTNKTVWTLLDMPYRSHDVPAFKRLSEADVHHRTIKNIKENTKGWTVGPLDFSGHGRVFQNGGNSFVALCMWHPALTPKQKQFQTRSWNAKGVYKPGVRKLALADIPAAGEFPGVDIPLTASFIDTQLKIIRASERHREIQIANGIQKRGRRTLQSRISSSAWKTMSLEDPQLTRRRALEHREAAEKKAALEESRLKAEKVLDLLITDGSVKDTGVSEPRRHRERETWNGTFGVEQEAARQRLAPLCLTVDWEDT
ncbi:hypothetical protein B0H11DRAFT_2245903 [Mycena galericulata]|nr:hypothetical protein B0H11DRAFT_2245903 [Mycena galericulata]